MRKLTKILIVVGVLSLTATLVGAELLTYFGSVETTINVTSAMITIDGNSYDTPVTDEFNAASGYTNYGPVHTIYNNGDHSVSLNWNFISVPPEGMGTITAVTNDVSHAPINMSSIEPGATQFVFAYVIGNTVPEGYIYTVTATLVPS